MAFSDLEEQLESMGYGNQWSQVQQKLAMRSAKNAQSDLARVRQHNLRFPQKHKAAKARWYAQRMSDVSHRVGKQNCQRCFAVLVMKDLIAQAKISGHCRKCRKELFHG